jgi:hypothetical protein
MEYMRKRIAESKAATKTPNRIPTH